MRRAVPVLLVCVHALACARAPATPSEVAERTRQLADQHHHKAIALQGNPRKAEQAARLHRASARLRPRSDPRAYDCYAQASNVLLAAGEVERAKKLMVESAEFALSRGDSLNAARSFAYAAVIASRQGMTSQVVSLAARMKTVARAPTISRADLDALTEQIAQAMAKVSTNTSSARVPAR